MDFLGDDILGLDVIFFPCHAVCRQEIGRWGLVPPVKSLVDGKGRRHLAIMPPSDTQGLRHSIASKAQHQQKLIFRCVSCFGLTSGEHYSLSQCEAAVGASLNFFELRVCLPDSPVPWEQFQELPGIVVASESGSPTQLSKLLAQCFEAVQYVVEHQQAGFHAQSLAGVLKKLEEVAQSLTLQTVLRSRQGRSGGFEYTPQHMLNAVLLTDNLKDVGQLKQSVMQSLCLVLEPMLLQHLLQQNMNIPSQALLFRFRLILDLATMLFSRRTYFQLSSDWIAHIRSDASPLFGKEFFVTEIDHVGAAKISEETSMADMKSLISRRILPPQLVGSRAASTAHKVFRLRMSLASDTEDANQTLLRTYSIAVDMGTESRMFVSPGAAPISVQPQARQGYQAGQPLDMVFPEKVPDADTENNDFQDVSRMCPRALPISDADHVTCLKFQLIKFHCIRFGIGKGRI